MYQLPFVCQCMLVCMHCPPWAPCDPKWNVSFSWYAVLYSPFCSCYVMSVSIVARQSHIVPVTIQCSFTSVTYWKRQTQNIDKFLERIELETTNRKEKVKWIKNFRIFLQQWIMSYRFQCSRVSFFLIK